ncbi:MAG: hypothetical protein ACM3XM_02325 [Mycobacterium leprae]
MMGVLKTWFTRFRRSQRGGIDSYVTTAVMIFLAVGGAVVLLGLNNGLMGWVTKLVDWLTGHAVPTP